MFTFSVSDSFYRFNCTPDVSPLGDTSFVENHEKSKLFILPYTKYSFCATMLNDAYSLLDSELQTVIIFLPTYNYCSEKLMTFCADKLIEIDRSIRVDFDILDKFRERYAIDCEEFSFEYEEILRIHIDFLSQRYPNIKIVPLLYYNLSEGIITEILSNNWGGYSFIFLSNLSSGFNYKDATQFDTFTANSIEKNQAKDITFERFTAFRILPEILGFAKSNGFSFLRLGLTNSGEFNTNLASTTGYGAWMLYEGSSAKYIKKYYAETIINFVKFNLKNNVHIACSQCFNFPEVFNQEFKIVLSLEKDGFVRGVNTSKIPEKLFKALVKGAFGVAFSDNRFAPVQPDEIDWLKINVVILNDNVLNSVVIES